MIDDLLATFEKEDPKYLISIQKAKDSNEDLFNEIGNEIILSFLKTYPEINLIDLVSAKNKRIIRLIHLRKIKRIIE